LAKLLHFLDKIWLAKSLGLRSGFYFERIHIFFWVICGGDIPCFQNMECLALGVKVQPKGQNREPVTTLRFTKRKCVPFQSFYSKNGRKKVGTK